MDFLFDIGKVLLDFDFETSLKRYLPEGADAVEAAFAELLERKDEFEAGRVPMGEYIPWAMEKIGFTGSVSEFRTAWQEIFTPIPATWSLARRLRRGGHRLILFSNTNSIHVPYCYEAYRALFDLFDHSVLSFEVGAIKPERTIYQHAIDTYGLVPERTIYIDDLSANIATGDEFGFITHQYVHDDPQNHAELEELVMKHLESQ